MGKLHTIKIDAYAHMAPVKYLKALQKLLPKELSHRIPQHAPLYDLDYRFRIMDKYEVMQVLAPTEPALEEVVDPQKAEDLAKLANDEMAELVSKYPDRFLAAIAYLPMNNMDATLKEVDRAINDLRFRGVLVYSNVNGKPLDSPEFMPLYEKMAKYKLPIYIHPQRRDNFSDYTTESKSKYNIYSVFGWPYDTTVAMTRLVLSGVLEKYPDLRVVTHHGGGMVPYFADRIIVHHDRYDGGRLDYRRSLTKAPIDYFKMFYADTAIHGNTLGLMCAHSFFGPDHLVFGADMPRGDRQYGIRTYRQTINAIEEMDISDEDKKKIFENNARNLMRLPI
jgi:predicted TIM-barrel fold metal-dependent hydrolase